MTSKEERWRREGMAWALKIAEERGIDGLKADMKKRGVSFTPIGITKKAEDDFVRQVKENCILSFSAIMAMVLRDKYGFGSKRMSEYAVYFYEMCDSIYGEWLTYDDIFQVIKDETGVDLLAKKAEAQMLLSGVESKLQQSDKERSNEQG